MFCFQELLERVTPNFLENKWQLFIPGTRGHRSTEHPVCLELHLRISCVPPKRGTQQAAYLLHVHFFQLKNFTKLDFNVCNFQQTHGMNFSSHQILLTKIVFVSYLFIFACAGSSLPHTGFLWLGGGYCSCSARTSHCDGFLVQSMDSRALGL